MVGPPRPRIEAAAAKAASTRMRAQEAGEIVTGDRWQREPPEQQHQSATKRQQQQQQTPPSPAAAAALSSYAALANQPPPQFRGGDSGGVGRDRRHQSHLERRGSFNSGGGSGNPGRFPPSSDNRGRVPIGGGGGRGRPPLRGGGAGRGGRGGRNFDGPRGPGTSDGGRWGGGGRASWRCDSFEMENAGGAMTEGRRGSLPPLLPSGEMQARRGSLKSGGGGNNESRRSSLPLSSGEGRSGFIRDDVSDSGSRGGCGGGGGGSRGDRFFARNGGSRNDCPGGRFDPGGRAPLSRGGNSGRRSDTPNRGGRGGGGRSFGAGRGRGGGGRGDGWAGAANHEEQLPPPMQHQHSEEQESREMRGGPEHGDWRGGCGNSASGARTFRYNDGGAFPPQQGQKRQDRLDEQVGPAFKRKREGPCGGGVPDFSCLEQGKRIRGSQSFGSEGEILSDATPGPGPHSSPPRDVYGSLSEDFPHDSGPPPHVGAPQSQHRIGFGGPPTRSHDAPPHGFRAETSHRGPQHYQDDAFRGGPDDDAMRRHPNRPFVNEEHSMRGPGPGPGPSFHPYGPGPSTGPSDGVQKLPLNRQPSGRFSHGPNSNDDRNAHGRPLELDPVRECDGQGPNMQGQQRGPPEHGFPMRDGDGPKLTGRAPFQQRGPPGDGYRREGDGPPMTGRPFPPRGPDEGDGPNMPRRPFQRQESGDAYQGGPFQQRGSDGAYPIQEADGPNQRPERPFQQRGPPDESHYLRERDGPNMVGLPLARGPEDGFHHTRNGDGPSMSGRPFQRGADDGFNDARNRPFSRGPPNSGQRGGGPEDGPNMRSQPFPQHGSGSGDAYPYLRSPDGHDPADQNMPNSRPFLHGNDDGGSTHQHGRPPNRPLQRRGGGDDVPSNPYGPGCPDDGRSIPGRPFPKGPPEERGCSLPNCSSPFQQNDGLEMPGKSGGNRFQMGPDNNRNAGPPPSAFPHGPDDQCNHRPLFPRGGVGPPDDSSSLMQNRPFPNGMPDHHQGQPDRPNHRSLTRGQPPDDGPVMPGSIDGPFSPHQGPSSEQSDFRWQQQQLPPAARGSSLGGRGRSPASGEVGPSNSRGPSLSPMPRGRGPSMSPMPRGRGPSMSPMHRGHLIASSDQGGPPPLPLQPMEPSDPAIGGGGRGRGSWGFRGSGRGGDFGGGGGGRGGNGCRGEGGPGSRMPGMSYLPPFPEREREELLPPVPALAPRGPSPSPSWQQRYSSLGSAPQRQPSPSNPPPPEGDPSSLAPSPNNLDAPNNPDPNLPPSREQPPEREVIGTPVPHAPTPPPEPSSPSELVVAITRLADLEAQMEFAFAKHMQFLNREKELRAEYNLLDSLAVGMDAFKEDLEGERKPATTAREDDAAPPPETRSAE